MVTIKLVRQEAGDEPVSFAVATEPDTRSALNRIERLETRLKDLGFTHKSVKVKHKIYDSYQAPSALEQDVDWIAFDIDVVANGDDDEIVRTVLETVVGQTDLIENLRPRATLQYFEQEGFDTLSRALVSLSLVTQEEVQALD